MKQILILLSISVALNMYGQKVQELGSVNWLRDYDQALAISAEEKKPILLLFQEVPGCATCKNYGDNVLSNPLIADVIQHYFVPLAIFNNKGGEDRRILEKYKEPTWNNPVVRIVDSKGKNLIKRLSANYSSSGLLDAMMASFTERGKKIPQDILLLKDIVDTNASKEITYSMYCFWSGEKTYGKIDGVYSTEAGWQNGKEVVKVSFDPTKVTEKELTKKGKQSNNADQIFSDSVGFRKDKDPKYYLKNSAYSVLAMHPLQAARINSLLGQGVKNIDEWLFPSQRSYLAKAKKNKLEKLYDESFQLAWAKMVESI